MTYTFRRGVPAGNPIANALVILAGILVIAVSIVIGFFAFVIIASLMLVLSAVVAIRMWWLRRKLRRNGGGSNQTATGPSDGQQVIEGEYHVVVEERDDAR